MQICGKTYLSGSGYVTHIKKIHSIGKYTYLEVQWSKFFLSNVSFFHDRQSDATHFEAMSGCSISPISTPYSSTDWKRVVAPSTLNSCTIYIYTNVMANTLKIYSICQGYSHQIWSGQVSGACVSTQELGGSAQKLCVEWGSTNTAGTSMFKISHIHKV